MNMHHHFIVFLHSRVIWWNAQILLWTVASSIPISHTSDDTFILIFKQTPVGHLFKRWFGTPICQVPSKHALTGPIQELNGQVRAIRANLPFINPVWDLYGLPVWNLQYHALINPVENLYVFACMTSATTSPYRSCTWSVWGCLNLQQGGSPKRRETHWRRRLAPTLNHNWHRLWFYSRISR